MKFQGFLPQTSGLLLAALASLPVWASQYDAELLQLTNAERSKLGIANLCISQQLTSAAQAHAEDMANSDYFNHTGLNGSSSSTRIASTGYAAVASGENIAAGSSSASATMQQWVKSSGHYANITRTNYTEVGFGYAFSANSSWGYYWVQVFAKPSGSSTCSSNSNSGNTNTGNNTPTTTAASTLLNISTRAYLSGGENDPIAGFIINGDKPLKVMIRGIATTAGSGVNPSIKLLKYNAGVWQTVDNNDEWENHSNARAVTQLAVNLQLPDRSGNDAGMLLDLNPGVYSALLSSTGGPGLASISVDAVQ